MCSAFDKKLAMLMAVLTWMCLLSPTVASRDAASLATSKSLERNGDLDKDWSEVPKVPLGNGRVASDGFKTYYVDKFQKLGLLSEPGKQNFLTFLGNVFEAAFSMMLLHPQLSEKYYEGMPTLGEHCFKYAGALAGEYYFGGSDGLDQLGLSGVKALNDDWNSAAKEQVGGQGRVSLESFKQVYVTKFASLLNDQTRPRYKEFLSFTFAASFNMMLAKSDLDAKKDQNGGGTLGGHCFRYAGLMAGEFYFSGGSGYSDLLHLVS
eukprot:CAMPEP_0172740566 /NCGR_PEP_ID=MMETSP1074-20121228/125161_1 /TAXON_ID=2916 /ORGANISM="Ceratium fusus, Strain PA161109" /LENGTH=263 /DNA_ID=CAMNT_0013570707 /DNA_START=1 /DNA_END=792 /DNA_ORIENTATION=-